MTRMVCLLGSPRADGNSDQLAATFLDAAERAGAHITRHALRDLRFDGPSGWPPQASDLSEIKDDLTPVLSDVAEADVVVFATPIYFCNMSGLMKLAFDRFFAFFVPDYVTAPEPSKLGRDKVFVLIQTQGEGVERYADLLDQYAPALDKLGFVDRHLLRACGVRQPGDVRNDPCAMGEAVALAKKLSP